MTDLVKIHKLVNFWLSASLLSEAQLSPESQSLLYAYFECPLLEEAAAGKQVAFFWYQVSSKIPRSINTPGP